MEESLAVKVEHREERGKNACRRLRAAGKIPAILYGGDRDSVALTLDPEVMRRILHSRSGVNTILTLELEGKNLTQEVMIKSFDLDPVRDELIHVDLVRISENVAVEVSVPIAPKGEPIGVRTQGGVLDVVRREIRVRCLPSLIPGELPVEVAHLHINESLRVHDLAMPEGVAAIDDHDAVIISVSPPRVEKEVALEEEAVVPPEGEAAESVPEEKATQDKEKAKEE